MTWLASLLALAAVQDRPPLVLERTFGDDRWLASPEAFERVSLSPDGRRLAATSRDTRLQVWDVERRRLLHETTFGEKQKAFDLLLPDADTVLVSHADGFLRTWSLTTPDRPSAEYRIPARSHLWPSPKAGEVHVGTTRMDWRTGEAKIKLQPPSETYALAADEKRIFTGHESEIIEWDAETGAQKERRRFDRTFGRVNALALEAAGKRILSGHECGRLLEWAPEPSVLLKPARDLHPLVACGWLPESGGAVAVTSTSKVRRPDAKDDASRNPPLLGAASASFARGGALLALAEAPATRRIAEVPLGWNHPGPWSIVLWDMKAGDFWRPEGGAHDLDILQAAIQGARLVTLSFDAIVLWDRTKGDALARVVDRPRGFALDGGRLLTSSAGGLQLWDLETGRRLAAIPAAVGWSVGLVGRRAVLSRGTEVDIWDLDSGRKEGSIAAGDSADRIHGHSEAGRAVIGFGRSYGLLDVERREWVARTPTGMMEKTLSTDGRHAALLVHVEGGYDYQVVETSTGKVVGRKTLREAAVELQLQGPTLWIQFAGNRVARWAWASGDLNEFALTRPIGTLVPLDDRHALISSGSQIHEVDLGADSWSPAATGHRGAVAKLLLLDDGRSVLSYGADRTARLWSRKRP